MKAKDIKWCPQHGYPLPCNKCGRPLSHTQQKDVYESGRQAGIKEVVEWIKEHQIGNEFSAISVPKFTYLTKLKEWGIIKAESGD